MTVDVPVSAQPRTVGWRRRVRRLALALAAAILLLAAWWLLIPRTYGPTDGVHIVDLAQVGPEERCVDVSEGGCGAMATVAEARLPPWARVTATWYARPTCGGQVCIFAGLQQPGYIIFDLADGTRWAVEVTCGPSSAENPSGCALR